MSTTIQDVAEIQIGYQTGSRIQPAPGSAFRLVQASDITDDLRISRSALLRIEPERDPERYLVGPEDVLFLARGNRNCALVPQGDLENTIASNYFFILRPAESILPRYLAWWINQSAAQHFLAERAAGSTVFYIRRADFETLPIAVPSLATQEAIITLEGLRAHEEQLMHELISARRQLVSARALATISNEDRT